MKSRAPLPTRTTTLKAAAVKDTAQVPKWRTRNEIHRQKLNEEVDSRENKKRWRNPSAKQPKLTVLVSLEV